MDTASAIKMFGVLEQPNRRQIVKDTASDFVNDCVVDSHDEQDFLLNSCKFKKINQLIYRNSLNENVLFGQYLDSTARSMIAI